MFETGTNVWRKYDAWPPKGSEEQTLYFQADGRLADHGRSSWNGVGGDEFDEFVSDPAKPVPYYRQDGDRDGQGVHDRRPALRRPPAGRARLPDASR